MTITTAMADLMVQFAAEMLYANNNNDRHHKYEADVRSCRKNLPLYLESRCIQVVDAEGGQT